MILGGSVFKGEREKKLRKCVELLKKQINDHMDYINSLEIVKKSDGYLSYNLTNNLRENRSKLKLKTEIKIEIEKIIEEIQKG